MMLQVALAAMAVITMVTMPMEEMITEATTMVMVEMLKATMAMAAWEAMLLVVSFLQFKASSRVHKAATITVQLICHRCAKP